MGRADCGTTTSRVRVRFLGRGRAMGGAPESRRERPGDEDEHGCEHGRSAIWARSRTGAIITGPG